MGLPRGFKAACNRTGSALRLQMGVAPEAPIDIAKLSARLNLPLLPLSKFKVQVPEAVAQLKRDMGAFSALLLPIEPGLRIILVNDHHSLYRCNSSIAHEIAHALLAHPPLVLFDGSGHRKYEKELEQEANCLAGFILIPNEAAWHIVRTGMTPREACDLYTVSMTMLQFRLNSSGARIRYKRSLIRRVAFGT